MTTARPAPNSAPRVLTPQRFDKLLTELQALIESTDDVVSTERITGYWKIGQRIQAERLAQESGYHNSVLRDLARALGVTARTLQRAVLFHSAYSEAPPEDGLSWAHYRILAGLSSSKERVFYTRQALEQGWGVRQLEAALRSDLFAGKDWEKPRLTRPPANHFIYRATVVAIVDADTLDFDIDLGFQTWTKRRIRLAAIDAPEPGTPEGRKAKTFVSTQLLRARTIVLQSEKADLHGRYVAHVFLSPVELSLDQCFQEGTHLNDLLLQKGHAEWVG